MSTEAKTPLGLALSGRKTEKRRKAVNEAAGGGGSL